MNDEVIGWDVIDVEAAWPYFADTAENRDLFVSFIKHMGHTPLVKEITHER
jgi:hypothetical protein